eukprot:GDKK01018242.1.p1 GENE.GDKK01018242.1~~GDKK01018242.1.p1  ORF type:complete len:689 (-),score=144.64 GDKK01018242.1:77-2143(-)
MGIGKMTDNIENLSGMWSRDALASNNDLPKVLKKFSGLSDVSVEQACEIIRHCTKLDSTHLSDSMSGYIGVTSDTLQKWCSTAESGKSVIIRKRESKIKLKLVAQCMVDCLTDVVEESESALLLSVRNQLKAAQNEIENLKNALSASKAVNSALDAENQTLKVRITAYEQALNAERIAANQNMRASMRIRKSVRFDVDVDEKENKHPESMKKNKDESSDCNLSSSINPDAAKRTIVTEDEKPASSQSPNSSETPEVSKENCVDEQGVGGAGESIARMKAHALRLGVRPALFTGCSRASLKRLIERATADLKRGNTASIPVEEENGTAETDPTPRQTRTQNIPRGMNSTARTSFKSQKSSAAQQTTAAAPTSNQTNNQNQNNCSTDPSVPTATRRSGILRRSSKKAAAAPASTPGMESDLPTNWTFRTVRDVADYLDALPDALERVKCPFVKLGLSPPYELKPTERMINVAFKKLAAKLHPDKSTSENDRLDRENIFKQINIARNFAVQMAKNKSFDNPPYTAHPQSANKFSGNPFGAQFNPQNNHNAYANFGNTFNKQRQNFQNFYQSPRVFNALQSTGSATIVSVGAYQAKLSVILTTSCMYLGSDRIAPEFVVMDARHTPFLKAKLPLQNNAMSCSFSVDIPNTASSAEYYATASHGADQSMFKILLMGSARFVGARWVLQVSKIS